MSIHFGVRPLMSSKFLFGALILIVHLLAAVSVFSQSLLEPRVTRLEVETPTRILFVGNSYFYYNDSLHNHVARMLEADNPYLHRAALQFKSSTISGASLAHHPIEWLVTPGHIGVMEPFELVILHDGSAQPLSTQGRARSREIISKYAVTIRAQGSQVALYMTHAYAAPHQRVRADNTPNTAKHYIETGNEINVLVIPVGLAFEEAYRRRPEIKLHAEFDGSHPNLLGTYLAACVSYTSIYGKACKGNSYNYFSRINASDLSFLQEVGDDVVTQFLKRKL